MENEEPIAPPLEAVADEPRPLPDEEQQAAGKAAPFLADEDGVPHQRESELEEPSLPIADADPLPDALTAQFLADATGQAHPDEEEARRMAVLEAIVYVADEPLSADQIAKALGEPLEQVKARLNRLVAEYNGQQHGLTVKEVAGGYKMATKPEYHEAVRTFVKNLNPPLKLSLAALETLAVISYKQPITAPEIMEIRGVQGAGVLKTLVDRKLITTAGRKNVVGKPILYKTTKEFLVQFGLRDLTELPTLKEFEDLRRFAFTEAGEAEVDAEALPAAGEMTERTQDENAGAEPEISDTAETQQPEEAPEREP